MAGKKPQGDVAAIRALAEDVYRSLGSGHQECVYERAMQVGLRLQGIKYESQKVVELKYKDHYVGEGFPDLIVHLEDGPLVVEIKAVGQELGRPEQQQLRNYLAVLNIPHGLLINFQQPNRTKKRHADTLQIVPVTLTL